MNNEPNHSASKSEPNLVNQIGSKAARKLRAQRNPSHNVWFGLGMMGLIGWSVTIPTIVGAMLGLWLDRRNPEGRSWTLALLVGGLTIGCFNAWHWVTKEDDSMREEQEDNDE